MALVASSPGCDALTGRCPPRTLLGVHAPGPHGDAWRLAGAQSTLPTEEQQVWEPAYRGILERESRAQS